MTTVPLDQRRTRVVLTIGWILFWLLMMAIAVQDYLRGGGRHLWQPILWEGSSALVSTAMLSWQWLYGARLNRHLHTPWRWFWLQVRLLPVICVLFIAGVYAIRHLVYALAGMTYTHVGWGELFVYESIKVALYFSLLITIIFGVRSYAALAAEKTRAEQSLALARQAQLHQLTQQIQPHFLFNALNTVSSLMHSDLARADQMLTRLSDVLRASLEIGEQPEATLGKELTVLRAYADLMSERFSDRVDITWRIDAGLAMIAVPAMSLQILLENVFKHTVERHSRTTRIAIAAHLDGDQLVLQVEDDGGRLLPDAAPDARAPAAPGLGLANLRARLHTLHGAQATLQLHKLEPAGVLAEMRLPCGS